MSTCINDNKLAEEMTRWLIDVAGCEPTHEDGYTQTCLFYAARDGRPKLVHLFIAHGCKVNHADTYG